MVDNKEAVAAVAKANADFTQKLYPLLVEAKGTGENLVASSFSLSSVMALLELGAGGASKAQIQSGLNFPKVDLLEGYQGVLAALENSDKNFTLEAANRLYVKDGFELLDDYLAKAAEHFKAEAQNVNFADEAGARKIINDWVESKTNNKIEDFIPEGLLDDFTRLVLVNAVYFKGDWATKFYPEGTRKHKFVTASEGDVEVDTMFKTFKVEVGYWKERKTQVLRLPCKGDRLDMLFLLPDKAEGFADMEANLHTFDFIGFKPNAKEMYFVGIPKFKLESSLELTETLQKLGVKDIFDPSVADFSALAKDPRDLYVSAVLQKAFVEVNEEGTEAAAATGAISSYSMAVHFPEFVCDRPFFFTIRDNSTGMILFSGRVVNPAKA